MPVVKEERLLAHTQQTSDEGEDGKSMLCFRAHVQRLRIQLFHKVLQTGHVDLVFHCLKRGRTAKTVLLLILSFSLTAATGTRISTNSPATECLTSLSLTSRKNCAHSCMNWKECSKSSNGTIFTRKNFMPMRSDMMDCVVCVEGSRILSVVCALSEVVNLRSKLSINNTNYIQRHSRIP